MLSLRDVEVMRRSGFAEFEVREVNSWTAPDGTPQHIDLTTPGWKQVLKSREKFMHRYMKGGTYAGYIKTIENIHKKLAATGEEGDDSMATFLRAEYSRIMVPKTDYQKSRENRALSIIRKAYK